MTLKNYLAKGIKENLRRNIWLTILLLLAFLGTLPVQTLMALDQARHNLTGNVSKQMIEAMKACVGPSNSGVMVITLCGGAFLALAGFFFLYSQEKTDFYHSLPLRRPQLFIIQYISGILSFLIPYAICLGLALAVGGFSGAVTGAVVNGALYQAAVTLLFFLCFYGTGILAILLTGNLFIGALGFGGLLSYGPILYWVYTSLNDRFFRTLAEFGTKTWTYCLSPVLVYMKMARSFLHGGETYWPLLYGLIYGILVFVISLLVYNKRPSESFQRAIAFRKLEPVIKVCIAVPGAVIIALFFSGRMYEHNFLWLCLGCLVAAVVLLGILNFLFTLDIKKCLKPGLSSGVTLALLALLLLIYRLDVLGVDSYLPDKNRIQSMSVCLNSINGNLSYPEAANIYDTGEFLEKSRVETFDKIYELAEKFVAYFNENKEDDDFQDQAEMKAADSWYSGNYNNLTEDTMVSVYIAYHLKSGRDVYRMYYVPESQELVENIGEIYDNWEFRKAVLPTSYVDWEKIQDVYTESFLQSGKKLEVSEEKLQNIYKTYKGELESLSFAKCQEQAIIGYLRMDEKLKDEAGGEYSYTYKLPVYESFEKTRGLLEEAGNPMPKVIPIDQVLDVQIMDFTELDENGEYKSVTIDDSGIIESLLKSPTLLEGRYGVGSGIDYQHSITVRWKDRDKPNLDIYPWKSQNLSQYFEEQEN